MTRQRKTTHDVKRQHANPKIDVFVLNYNGRNHLKRCISSLFRMTWTNFRVYVVDNGSTDGSQDFVRRDYPKVKLIEMGANVGFSRALNLAVSRSDAPFVCLLNNDMKVTPNWLTVLMKDFHDPNVAVTVPKMYDFLGRLNSTGGVCDYYGFAFNRGIGEVDRGQYDRPCYVAYGCLGAAIVRKSVFDEIGYLDNAYVFYHEDVDFSWRLILRGHKIAYNPKSVVFHHHMGTMMAIGRARIIGFWERNRFRTLLKNYQIKTLITVLPTLAILKILHIGYALAVNRDAKEVRAVLSAYIWNLRYLKDTIRERRIIQVSRRAPDSELRRLLIPWSIELRLGLGKMYHPIARRGPGFMLSHSHERSSLMSEG